MLVLDIRLLPISFEWMDDSWRGLCFDDLPSSILSYGIHPDHDGVWCLYFLGGGGW